jgi:hypothetical protein
MRTGHRRVVQDAAAERVHRNVPVRGSVRGDSYAWRRRSAFRFSREGSPSPTAEREALAQPKTKNKACHREAPHGDVVWVRPRGAVQLVREEAVAPLELLGVIADHVREIHGLPVHDQLLEVERQGAFLAARRAGQGDWQASRKDR